MTMMMWSSTETTIMRSIQETTTTRSIKVKATPTMSGLEERLKRVKQQQVNLKLKMRKEGESLTTRAEQNEGDTADEVSENYHASGSTKSDFDYTMRDFERWANKLSRTQYDYGKTDANDYDIISKQTYDREVADLLRGIRDQNDGVNVKEVHKTEVLRSTEQGLVVNDDTLKVQDLANRLKQVADKRFKKRSLEVMKRNTQYEQDYTGYVNEKNKQFNMKLDRELAKNK